MSLPGRFMMTNGSRGYRGALASLGIIVAAGAQAGHITTMDCNIDAYNLTGQTANDFDIQLGGVAKSEVLKTFHNIFPNVEVTEQPYGSLIHYYGREFAPGDSVHIGYEIFPAGPIGTIDQYWSYDGAKLGGPAFRCNKPTIFSDGNVTNTGSTDVWIQRRFAVEPDAVDLQNDLNTGTSFWNNATLIDQSPIALLAGATADYAFANVGAGSYTMMYDVCSDAQCSAGHVSETVFSSVYYTPEPGVLGLVGSAGLAALGASALRRRRRA